MNKRIRDFFLLTVGTLMVVVGVYFFKFPNNFSTGGVSGISVILSALLPDISTGQLVLGINLALLLVGFLVFGRSFGIKTVYCSLLMSISIYVLERVVPLDAPLTSQPMLDLVFSVMLPAVGSAILFNSQGSTGGTDIVAMIFKKYTSVDIGKALFCVDLIIVAGSCFVFDIQTGLFSFTGLMAKTLVIDGVIENINLCKYFTIVCEHPEPICDFIHNKLHRGATIFRAEGSFAHHEKTVVLSVMKRSQAVQLRNYIRQTEPHAFMMITNSSEIIGKGFRGLN